MADAAARSEFVKQQMREAQEKRRLKKERKRRGSLGTEGLERSDSNISDASDAGSSMDISDLEGADKVQSMRDKVQQELDRQKSPSLKPSDQLSDQPAGGDPEAISLAMGACSGCGLAITAAQTLECPTCLDLSKKGEGSRSLFCSKNCFETNWRTHKQTHKKTAKKSAGAKIASSIPVSQAAAADASTAATKQVSAAAVNLKGKRKSCSMSSAAQLKLQDPIEQILKRPRIDAYENKASDKRQASWEKVPQERQAKEQAAKQREAEVLKQRQTDQNKAARCELDTQRVQYIRGLPCHQQTVADKLFLDAWNRAASVKAAEQRVKDSRYRGIKDRKSMDRRLAAERTHILACEALRKLNS